MDAELPGLKRRELEDTFDTLLDTILQALELKDAEVRVAKEKGDMEFLKKMDTRLTMLKLLRTTTDSLIGKVDCQLRHRKGRDRDSGLPESVDSTLLTGESNPLSAESHQLPIQETTRSSSPVEDSDWDSSSSA